MEMEGYLAELGELLKTQRWALAEELVVKYKEKIKDSWAYVTIPAICNYVRENPVDQIRHLLMTVCLETDPKEALIYLMEHCYSIQGSEEPQYVISLLPALEICLGGVKHHNLEWGLGEIHAINVVQSQSFYTSSEDYEANLMNPNDKPEHLTTMYFFMAYTRFLDSLFDRQTDTKSKRLIVHYIMLTLEHPLAHLDLDLEESMPYAYATRIIKEYLPAVNINLMPLFENYPPHQLFQLPSLEDDVIKKSQALRDILDFPNPIGMGTLSFLIFCKNVVHPPLIYTHRYLLECVMPFIIKLLEENDVFAKLKALELGSHFIASRILPESLPIDILDRDDFFKLPKILFLTIRYNHAEMLRNKARKLLFAYFDAFQRKSKLHLLMSLYRSCDSGPRGYFISIYKNTFHKESNEVQREKDIFTDPKNLVKFLKMILQMPNLEDSQLLNLSDSIMGALNFLIYFLLLKSNPLKDLIPDPDLAKALRDFMDLLEKNVKVAKDKFRIHVNRLSCDDQTPSAIEARSSLSCIDLMDSVHSQVQSLIKEKLENLSVI